MTTPQQPPPQQPPSPSTAQQIAEIALVTAIGTQLLSAVSPAVAVAGVYAVMVPGVRAYIQLQGVERQALFSALQIVMSFPPGQTGVYGPATIAMERANLIRRAQFVMSAAKRISADVSAARSRNQPVSAALVASVQRERRFYAQHLMAIWQRSQAGAAVDSTAMVVGSLLGWHTTRDAKTSADCLAADGKNFYADHMPLIGYPGTVHPHCRCQPGSPFPGARLLPSYGLPQTGKYRRAA